ncbi:MAG: OsmC family protein [Deltaproteobacteria bacterium]|nr:OsmC family protein [Deltaproteobacteria bacterium]
MFSQLARYASQLDIEIEDAEMDIRMTYDSRGKLLLADISPGCNDLTYIFKIQSPAPSEKIQEMLRLIEKGCHTINSLKNPVPVAGKLIHNGHEIALAT